MVRDERGGGRVKKKLLFSFSFSEITPRDLYYYEADEIEVDGDRQEVRFYVDED